MKANELAAIRTRSERGMTYLGDVEGLIEEVERLTQYNAQLVADRSMAEHNAKLLKSTVERLRGIVEKVAVIHEAKHNGYSMVSCAICGEYAKPSDQLSDNHKPDCPYRLAKEYIEESQ